MAERSEHGLEEKESFLSEMDDQEPDPKQDNKEESRTEEASEAAEKEGDDQKEMIKRR